MSHTASIDVNYHTLQKLSVPEIIKIYISNGWNLNDYGHISLRPLGDKDDFSWIELKLGQEDKLFKIIMKKIEANEDPALVLMLDRTEIGSVTTFFPGEMRINFLLMINRKVHSELPNWTDISWYLPYIVKPLLINGIAINEIAFLETI